MSDEDIIIQPDGRKNHKKWIVGGVLAVFCVALVVLLLFTVFRNGEITSSQDLDAINEEISIFSGTVLYGDGRQVDLSVADYSESIDYKFRREVMNNNQEYMELVIDEFGAIDGLIMEDGGLSLTDDDRNYLGVYKNKLQFLKMYLDDLDEDPLAVVDKIVEEGEEEAVSYIEARYGEYINSDNSSLRDYFTYKAEYEKLAVDVLQRINIDECISYNPIALNCAVEPLISEEEILRMQEIQDEMQMIVDVNIRYIITGCWSIYNIVNGAGAENV